MAAAKRATILVTAALMAMTPMAARAQGTADGPGVMQARTAAEASPYCGEVSAMASALAANMPDGERQCCYDTMMAGVFGEGYHGRTAPVGDGDLMCVLPGDGREMLPAMLAKMYGHIICYIEEDGKCRAYSDGSISLNGDGICQQNYEALKSVYQAAESLKARTEGMDAAGKALAVHDYIAGAYSYGSSGDGRSSEGALWMAANGRGVCAAYAVMFLILGRYCGLDAGAVLYYAEPDMMHMYDTVTLEDGEVRYVDVTWDDTTESHKYFLETREQSEVSHPGMAGK